MSEDLYKHRTLGDPIFRHFDKEMYTKSDEQKQAVVSIFMDWFNNQARLKPVPDLAERIAAMGPKLLKMAENLEIKFVDGKPVIKTDADSTTLLRLLRRGSSWFDPHPAVDEAIFYALLEGAR